MIDISKKEVKHFLIAAFIVTFAFAFDDGQPTLVISHWLKNFIAIFLGVCLVMLVHTLAHKIVAKRYAGKTEFRIWSVKQFGFKRREKFPLRGKFLKIKIESIPLGAVISIITAILTMGKFYFIAIEEFLLIQLKHRRIGFERENITEKEIAKIALAGPMANILFAYILKNFNSTGIFDQLIMINLFFAAYHMIPFSSLDGLKIFFGSVTMYVFSLVFIILSIVLLMLITPGLSMIIATILAFLISLTFFYQKVYPNTLGKPN